ncbi:hypothetical protein JAAARDRAFT_136458 [Jaapia argillacea MUCL 33604]|uniref:CxC2-like cysteine cluster KDZ transposase-associated domain-containing protein n=1 Tax=Jaapia argillacea MUCL 33604 TaxID=933084 RepID=A0A067PGH3_9AGAM|nr:hypothetical protein JAAARDRAFT_136458 [Jaapia argillacea MUCL 33604]
MKDLIDAILELEGFLLECDAYQPLQPKCQCGQPPTVRCIDCLNSVYWCSACIVKLHQSSLLHWVEEWNGSFFERRGLDELGLVIGLGHGGDLCSHRPKKDAGISVVVVHTNGVHRREVVPCHCAGHLPFHQQLLRAHYFPATLKQPSTVFTFSLLNHFHLSTLQSKVTAYDYFIVLKHLSNNAFPASVPERYHELLCVICIWRYLMHRKHSGHIHGIDDVLPHCKKGSLVPRCYACPEPHFNMLLNWENTPLNKR